MNQMDKHTKRKRGGMKWIFQPLMIWGALLGFVIFGALGSIRDAWYHQGPGCISYEEPDRTEVVTEGKYKRHEYIMGVFMLFAGVFTWVIIAKTAKDVNEQSNSEHTQAESRRIE